MPRRSDTSPAETKARLLDAAADVFAERGLAGASLAEIAARAGFTRGAVHWHFESKEQLLLAVVEQRLERSIERRETTAATARTLQMFNHSQRTAATRRAQVTQRSSALLMMEFWLAAARDPRLQEAASSLKDRLRLSIAEQVVALADRAGVGLPLPAFTIASALMALDDGFRLQDLLDETIGPGMLWDVVDLLTATLTTRD